MSTTLQKSLPGTTGSTRESIHSRETQSIWSPSGKTARDRGLQRPRDSKENPRGEEGSRSNRSPGPFAWPDCPYRVITNEERAGGGGGDGARVRER